MTFIAFQSCVKVLRLHITLLAQHLEHQIADAVVFSFAHAVMNRIKITFLYFELEIRIHILDSLFKPSAACLQS